MLACRITVCLEVPQLQQEQVLERLHQAVDQLEIDGFKVLDSSIDCKPVSHEGDLESFGRP
jgi:hypothetical protein